MYLLDGQLETTSWISCNSKLSEWIGSAYSLHKLWLLTSWMNSSSLLPVSSGACTSWVNLTKLLSALSQALTSWVSCHTEYFLGHLLGHTLWVSFTSWLPVWVVRADSLFEPQQPYCLCETKKPTNWVKPSNLRSEVGEEHTPLMSLQTYWLGCYRRLRSV